MMDFSGIQKNSSDIYYIASSVKKTRNLLKMKKGDDLYYQNTGIDLSPFIDYNLSSFVAQSFMSEYLANLRVFPNNIDVYTNKKGKLDIQINENVHFLIFQNGALVNEKETKENYHVNL